MVHNKVNPNKQDFIQELYEDLLPIATVFSLPETMDSELVGIEKDDENSKKTKS